MQNKGLIKFIAIILALVCIYQLSFTFVANKVKNDAKAYATAEFKKLTDKKEKGLLADDPGALENLDLNRLELKYLDSIKNEKVFLNAFTYDFVKDNQINKGLDLEGGINVILEISVRDILKGLANNTQDATFNKALADAKVNQRGNQTYLDAFFEAYDVAAKDSKTKLASPEIFLNKNLENEITLKMTDDQVKPVIRRKVDESIVSAFEVLRKRIDKFGVTQPNIQRLGESGRILVELPGAKDIDRAKKLLQSTAQLEFWETLQSDQVMNYLFAVNDALKATEVKSEEVASTEVKDSVKTEIESLLTDNTTDSAKVDTNNPLLDKMLSRGFGPVVAYFSPRDTATINNYFKRESIKSLRTPELRYAKLVWGKPTTIENDKKEQVSAVELYALKADRNKQAPISGGVVVDAAATFDQIGKPAVTMQMNGKGAKQWEELTGKVSQQKNAIAIVLDDIVYSAPGVSSGAISGGRSEITGSFTVEETQDLANVLKAGKLPAAADIVQSDVVGPSLGQEAIDNGILSFIIGMLLVVVWMILYYGKAGVFANISLIVNILFIFGILASLGAVLTLPGIAGIVLTIGMAVDANVIIFERAKEELDMGKTLEESVNYAFTWKGAMSSIFDANITTALTALILLVFGTGPIKGFATTLLIGIGTSLFTSIFITRILLDWSLSKTQNLTFSTPMSKNWFQNMNIDFLSKRKVAYAISSVLVIASLVSLFFINGLNQGVDFVGGRTFQVRFDKEVSANEVGSALTKGFGTNVEAKTFGTNNQLKITTKYKVNEEGEGIDSEVNQLLFDNLKPYLPVTMTYEQFVTNSDDKTVGILQATKVGPTIAEDIKTNAYWAVLGSLLVVFLYLLISFRRWQFSLGAVGAVFHDVIIVLGIYSIGFKYLPFNMEIDQAFIAAILTVIGYSLNDTVIVFDRVREFLSEHTTGTFNEVVNKALNTTISRTINTSFTTLIVLFSIFILGGETIRGFVFAILVGILVGTYSSLFIATPLMVDTINKQEARKKAFEQE
ncbi:protein translocase subunit SecDF [Flavobacterium orientale]|uniref:Multifunctional fusion protein n=1 Tax=Flavobacterium orientale TaxID=1756020 RepID=A0A916Y1L6_9FLAO|nr:protein translocase subunit SecDF [Flavobacterium orientale]GGD25754.1 protein translocase subunit SecDF [Flavobacterium orientale]